MEGKVKLFIRVSASLYARYNPSAVAKAVRSRTLEGIGEYMHKLRPESRAHVFSSHTVVSVLSTKVSRLECCEWSLATKSVTKVSYILAENVEYL